MDRKACLLCRAVRAFDLMTMIPRKAVDGGFIIEQEPLPGPCYVIPCPALHPHMTARPASAPIAALMNGRSVACVITNTFGLNSRVFKHLHG